MAEINCPWCYAPFTPVKRGVHIKRCCSPACKGALKTAARRYVVALMDAGAISVGELKRVSASRATRGARGSLSGECVSIDDSQAPLHAPENAFRRLYGSPMERDNRSMLAEPRVAKPFRPKHS